MHKIMFWLAIAVACFSLTAPQASAQDTVYFYTQIDQRTADYINGYWGVEYVNTEDLYYAYYTSATSRNGGKKGGGQKVQFGVIVGFFDTGIFGEGNLDSTGMWIDASRAYFFDFDIGFRLHGKMSLPIYPIE